MVAAIAVLKAKQLELVELMVDESKTREEKLAYTLMYDDLKEAIKILDKAFFAR